MALSAAKSSVSSLPPNGIWDKGSAPADRFQALGQELKAVQWDLFQKLNAKGSNAADSQTVQAVQSEFESLRSDLQQSMPQYPNPKQYIAALLGKCDRMYSWTITYHAGSASGPELARFTNVADEQRNFWTYQTSDAMGDQISGLADGVQKLENYATTCLQDNRPFSEQTDGGLFNKQKRSDLLTGMFNQESAGLGAVESSAASAMANGVFESSSTSCGEMMSFCDSANQGKRAFYYNKIGDLRKI